MYGKSNPGIDEKFIFSFNLTVDLPEARKSHFLLLSYNLRLEEQCKVLEKKQKFYLKLPDSDSSETDLNNYI